MKKRFVVSVILVLAMLLMVACGNSSDKNTDKGTGNDTGNTAEEEIPTIKLGHGASETFSAHYGALAFKEYAENAAKGKVNVEIYPNAQLGAERELVEAVTLGNLDIAVAMTFTVSSIVNIPELLLYELPWLVTDRDLMYDIVANNKSFKEITTDKFEAKGIKYLGTADIGYYGVTASTPIRTPADMAGKKFRTAENPLIVDWFGALNVNPTVVAISEVFTALQQGVIDGVYTTITMMSQTKTYEVAKEITSLNNTLGMTFLVMNLDKFNSLTADQQATLEEAGQKYILAQRESSETETERIVEEMEGEFDATFYSLSAAEVKPFRDAVAPVYETWIPKVGKNYYDETIAYIADWEKTNKK